MSKMRKNFGPMGKILRLHDYRAPVKRSPKSLGFTVAQNRGIRFRRHVGQFLGYEEGIAKMSGCRRCGECCKWIMIHMGSILYDKKWVEVRGGIIRGNYALLPCRCQRLMPDNRCELHEKGQKPLWCRVAPEQPEKYLDALGCKFFEVENGSGT